MVAGQASTVYQTIKHGCIFVDLFRLFNGLFIIVGRYSLVNISQAISGAVS